MILFFLQFQAEEQDHYHLQCHRGRSAIWNNLERGSLGRHVFYRSDNVTASYLDGWPAHAYLFESADIAALAVPVIVMLDVLVAGDNDIPFNLTLRQVNAESKVIVIPRSLAGERPSELNSDRESWSLFGCMEMAGSILLLTRAGYHESAMNGNRISGALAQMSITKDVSDRLIGEFQQAVNRSAKRRAT
jgi:hypothetical protein